MERAAANPGYGPMVARHRGIFLSGKTRPVEWREAQLSALQTMIADFRGGATCLVCTQFLG
jgi:hypothetical protein